MISFKEYLIEVAKWKTLFKQTTLKQATNVFKGSRKFFIPGETKKPGADPIYVKAEYFRNSDGSIDGKISRDGYEAVNNYENLKEFEDMLNGNK